MAVDGHLRLYRSHVGDIGVAFVFDFLQLQTVIWRKDVCIAFNISHHRLPHVFVDRLVGFLEHARHAMKCSLFLGCTDKRILRLREYRLRI